MPDHQWLTSLQILLQAAAMARSKEAFRPQLFQLSSSPQNLRHADSWHSLIKQAPGQSFQNCKGAGEKDRIAHAASHTFNTGSLSGHEGTFTTKFDSAGCMPHNVDQVMLEGLRSRQAHLDITMLIR